MKRIIYHIGTRKTASTTIQNTLSANRDALREQGVLYPATDRPPFEAHNKHNSVYHAVTKGTAEEFAAEKQAVLSEFEASGCHTMILSEEGFGSTPVRKLARYGDLVRGYAVETVCYLRRQDLFLESLWKQHIKFRDDPTPIADFTRRRAMRNRIRYDHILIDGWSRFSKVHAVNFDTAKKDGVFASFTRACDLPDLDEPSADNVSPSANCALVLNAINRAGLPVHKGRIMQAFARDKSRYNLGAALRREIMEESAPGNARIEAEYGIRFSPDLPEDQEEPLEDPDMAELARAMAWFSRQPTATGPGAKAGRKGKNAE